MAGWSVRKFRGIAPRNSALLLADDMAQSCANVVLTRGTLLPLKSNTTITGPTLKSGNVATIHRMGQGTASDTQYWLNWLTDVDVVRGPIFGDTTERTYFTDGTQPRVTDITKATTGGVNYPMASFALGVPAPSAAPSSLQVTGSPSSETALPETRVYTMAFVTEWDEPGPPSAPSSAVEVTHGQSVTMSLPATPSGDYDFKAKRIYRSVTGSTDTGYYFVAEVADSALTFTDTVAADDLGEELPSLTYLPPPAGLKGLIALPGGVMAGFVGKDVYFSEPYKPYAWPVQYSMTVDSDIVGLGAFDTTLLVLTKGSPFLISGSEPANYSMIKAELPQACVSKRSIVNIGGGVVFASPDGLFLIGGGVTKNLTEALFSRTEWQALNPSTMNIYVVDNTLVGFYGGTAGFMLNIQDGTFVPLNWYARAGYYDPIQDKLFLITGTNTLVSFNTGSALTFTWMSKLFYSPTPRNMAAARVEAAGYPVTFKYYADNVLKYTHTVANGQPFRLPAGFMANTFHFEVSGTQEIFSAGFAQSIEELANA
jgi:hypothetical protein